MTKLKEKSLDKLRQHWNPFASEKELKKGVNVVITGRRKDVDKAAAALDMIGLIAGQVPDRQ